MEAIASDLMKKIRKDPKARQAFRKALHSSPSERKHQIITVDGQDYTFFTAAPGTPPSRD